MGRAARMRRYKAVDPFNPNRGKLLAMQRRPEGKDLPVDEKKEKKKIPRGIREIMMGQKKIKELEQKRKEKQQERTKARSEAKKEAASGEPGAKKAAAASSSSVASSTTSSGQAIKFEGIRPGESIEAFNRRIKTEANKMLIEESKKSSRKAEKRREWRQKKKEALIKKKYGSDDEKEETEPVKDPRTGKVKVADFSQLRDEIKFGEQAYEPPKFTRLPRMKAKVVGVDSGTTFEQKRAMDLMRDRIRAQLGAKKASAQPSLSSIFRG